MLSYQTNLHFILSANSSVIYCFSNGNLLNSTHEAPQNTSSLNRDEDSVTVNTNKSTSNGLTSYKPPMSALPDSLSSSSTSITIPIVNTETLLPEEMSKNSPGIMKPDIVFFGEGLGDAFHRSVAIDKQEV